MEFIEILTEQIALFENIYLNHAIMEWTNTSGWKESYECARGL